MCRRTARRVAGNYVGALVETRHNCWLLVRAVACWLHDNYVAIRTRDGLGRREGANRPLKLQKTRK